MSFGIDDAIAAALKVLDKFIPDPAAKAKAETANATLSAQKLIFIPLINEAPLLLTV